MRAFFGSVFALQERYFPTKKCEFSERERPSYTCHAVQRTDIHHLHMQNFCLLGEICP